MPGAWGALLAADAGPRLAAGAGLAERGGAGGGSCWEAALAAAPEACAPAPLPGAAPDPSMLAAPGRARLAYELTRCHLSASGLEPARGGGCPAARDVGDCIRDLAGDSGAFHAYTEFFLRSLDLCFHVRHGTVERLLSRTVSQLGQGAADAAVALTGVREGMEALGEGQEELSRGQARLQEAGAAAAEAMARRQEETRAELGRLSASAAESLRRSARDAESLGAAQRELLEVSRAVGSRMDSLLAGLLHGGALSAWEVWCHGTLLLLGLFAPVAAWAGMLLQAFAAAAVAAGLRSPSARVALAAAIFLLLPRLKRSGTSVASPDSPALARLERAVDEIRIAQGAAAAVSSEVRALLEEFRPPPRGSPPQLRDLATPDPAAAGHRPRRSARRPRRPNLETDRAGGTRIDIGGNT